MSRRAAIIGGSLSGLLAARVLSPFFDEIVVLDSGAGVPQAVHNHILLAGGLETIESLLPGVDAELDTECVSRIDVAQDLAWSIGGIRIEPLESGVMTRLCSRDLLDSVVRRRVQALCPNVVFRTSCEVRGFVVSKNGLAIEGIRLLTAEKEEARLPADLVVDASGRRSQAPRWLAESGFPRPRESVVDAGMGISSRIYAVTSRAQVRRWKALLLWDQPYPTRMGVASEIEGGRMIIGFNGCGSDLPPADENGFELFASRFRDPQISDLIPTLEPLSRVHVFRRMENRRRHYEEMNSGPEGFVALGDAACMTNPRFSLGVSIAALGARILGDLAEYACERGFSGKFHGRLAKEIEWHWKIAAGADLRIPGARGDSRSLSTRLLHGYFWDFLVPALGDPNLYRRFIEVLHLKRHPLALCTPRAAFSAFGRRMADAF